MKALIHGLILLRVHSLPQSYCFRARNLPFLMMQTNNNHRHGEVNEDVSETLFGLLGCISGEPPSSNPTTLNSAISSLNAAISVTKEQKLSTTLTATERLFVNSAIEVANDLCETATDSTLGKKQTWQALQQKASILHQTPSDANALALSFVFGALSLMRQDSSKAAASAIASTTSRNKEFRHVGRNVANTVLKTFLIHSSCSSSLDLNTLTHFARAFKLTNEQDSQYSEMAAKAIQYSLGQDVNESFLSDNDNDEGLEKQKISAALALSCQIGPWSHLSPVMLVESAIPYGLWHAAEQVCMNAHKSVLSIHATSDDIDIVFDQHVALQEATKAVEVLVDAAMEARMYRLADNMATKLYKEGGKTRFIEARLYHAYDTISKVIYKRQLPIIERQVDRVDKAVDKVKSDGMTAIDSSAGNKIRKFVLAKLGEAGEVGAAHRLATMWNMDYIYDEEAILEAAAARRKRYLQYDEVLTGSTPELISDPEVLYTAFEHIQNDGPFGIDAEWDEDTIGASLFQFASQKEVLLIDIPALSSTKEGVKALSDTVGKQLDSSESVVIGFSPRQDLSRLRASPYTPEASQHWMSGASAVVDAQRLIGDAEPKLKTLGLSRACHHYLGKPLDKAEQCSIWSARPLSESQRIYAALDAWTCTAIYGKLYPMGPPNAQS